MEANTIAIGSSGAVAHRLVNVASEAVQKDRGMYCEHWGPDQVAYGKSPYTPDSRIEGAGVHWLAVAPHESDGPQC